MSGLREAVIGKFQDVYGDAPKWVARGPGRVNLIGE
ncbi:MAG: galactokinase family protein, partial [Anaerolineae bacterium]|nr:galactokinase family protein [Anaerolineae bacterium]